jgi:LPS export ABC transporter protein LptC
VRSFFLLLILAATIVSGACSNAKEPPVAINSRMADSADQVMFRARSLLTDRGLLRAELRADTAYFFDENTRIELVVVNVVFFTSTGAKNATLTSREGSYNTRLAQMEGRGNVVVISVDGRRLTTQQLLYDQMKNEIRSDSAFVLTEPGRTLRGIGFISDPNMTNIRVLKGASGRGAVTVPGQ